MHKIKYFITITLLLSSTLFAKSLTEEQKIDWLIEEVKKSNVIFIRNKSEHQAEEASKHLRFKLNNAKKMFWFFGPERKVTAQEFINKIASESSTTGEKYRIKLKNGKIITTKDWLDKKLLELDSKTKKNQ